MFRKAELARHDNLCVTDAIVQQSPKMVMTCEWQRHRIAPLGEEVGIDFSVVVASRCHRPPLHISANHPLQPTEHSKSWANSLNIGLQCQSCAPNLAAEGASSTFRSYRTSFRHSVTINALPTGNGQQSRNHGTESELDSTVKLRGDASFECSKDKAPSAHLSVNHTMAHHGI